MSFSIIITNLSSSDRLAAKYLDKILGFEQYHKLTPFKVILIEFNNTPPVDLKNFENIIRTYLAPNQIYLKDKVSELIAKIATQENFSQDSDLQQLHQFLFELLEANNKIIFETYQPIFA